MHAGRRRWALRVNWESVCPATDGYSRMHHGDVSAAKGGDSSGPFLIPCTRATPSAGARCAGPCWDNLLAPHVHHSSGPRLRDQFRPSGREGQQRWNASRAT
jgi:hypothetical protein